MSPGISGLNQNKESAGGLGGLGGFLSEDPSASASASAGYPIPTKSAPMRRAPLFANVPVKKEPKEEPRENLDGDRSEISSIQSGATRGHQAIREKKRQNLKKGNWE